ncbi:MAG: DNA repair protein RecO [Gammaproteobacteria bacterium]|nr:DNA repair protein RecO [Gammaproteobacteria bacterium]MCY4219628.1 DNA repair protein RecO [Gammaproteobacteria bacterium]MCY4275469.1 DNA repair protein RecO [Gammaproteobacteria bacterium]
MTKHRVNQQSGFILHRRPYSESSLLVDVFTRGYGRLTLIAKGSRRNKQRSVGLFIPFKPLLLSWSGKGNLPVLTGIESSRFAVDLSASARSCAYYQNELLLKLLHRFDSNEKLFDHYRDSLVALEEGINPHLVLRIFEKYLLREIGFGLILDHDASSGEAINEDAYYDYVPEKGPVYTHFPSVASISGKTLKALNDDNFESHEQLHEAMRLTRKLIDRQLNGEVLRTRKVIYAMRDFKELNQLVGMNT